MSYSIESWGLPRGYGIRGIGSSRAYVWGNKVVHIKTTNGDVYLGHSDPEKIVRDLDEVTGFVSSGGGNRDDEQHCRIFAEGIFQPRLAQGVDRTDVGGAGEHSAELLEMRGINCRRAWRFTSTRTGSRMDTHRKKARWSWDSGSWRVCWCCLRWQA